MTSGREPLARETLLARAAIAQLVLVQAPSGFGKTTLLRQLVARRGVATTWASLEAPTDLTGVGGLLASAARRVGLVSLAEAFSELADGHDARSTLDRVVAAVDRRPEAIVVVVDEAQFLDDSAAAWIGELARSLPDGSTVAVAGRRVPRRLRHLDVASGVRPDATCVIDEEQLRFDLADLEALLGRPRDNTDGANAPADDAAAILSTTQGWPAAVGLALAVRERTPDSLVPAGQPLDPSPEPDGAHLIEVLLRRLLATVDAATRDRIARLMVLPLLDDDVATAAAGEGALDELLDAGIPVSRRTDGWLVVPDPVRDALSPLAELGERERRRAAHALSARRQLAPALALLHRAGDTAGAVELLAVCEAGRLASLGLGPLRTAIETLGPEAVGRHPEIYVAAARVAELVDSRQRRDWLEAAVAASDGAGRPDVARAAMAELAREAVRHGDLDRAADLAASVLAGAGPDEASTRGRALVALGHLATVRATPDALVEASAHLEDAAALFRLSGEREWESDALLRLGYAVSYHGGRFELAVAQLSDALALLPSADRARGNALTYVAEVFRAVGRIQDADAAAREAIAIGQRIGDSWVVAAGCWAAMGNAAANGDLDGIRRWIAGTERSPGPWFDTGAGLEFLLEAGDHLAANGDEAGAREFHDRAVARATAAGGGDLHRAVAHLTFRIEATFGDPARAAELFDEIDGGAWAVQRNRWVRRMLRALAAQRAGDVASATTYVADGWRELESLGDATLFVRSEPGLFRALEPVLGSTARPDPDEARSGSIVTLLGGFAVRSAGADVTPAPGHPSTLVKLLAVRGPTPVDEVIDRLWPDADLGAGRSRLRNLLNRVRDRSGVLVERRGELLALADGTAVDWGRFDEAVTAAAAADPIERVGLARAAISLYVGELLPADRHLDWLAAPRERLRRRYLSLVDVVAEDALDRNDLDEALDLLELGIAAEPYDETRYAKATRALLDQGRRNAAADIARRGCAAMAELGVAPDGELATLATELAVTD